VADDLNWEPCACGGAVAWAYVPAEDAVYLCHRGLLGTGLRRRFDTRDQPTPALAARRIREWLLEVHGGGPAVWEGGATDLVGAGMPWLPAGVTAEPIRSPGTTDAEVGGRRVAQLTRPLRAELVARYGTEGARMIEYGPDDGTTGPAGPVPGAVTAFFADWRGGGVTVEGAVTVAEAPEATPGRETTMDRPENPLRGLRLCVTGKVGSFTREDLYARLNRLGAYFSERVDDSTDYLVVGERPGATKRTAARRYGIREQPASWLLTQIEQAQNAQSWSAQARVDTSAAGARIARDMLAPPPPRTPPGRAVVVLTPTDIPRRPATILTPPGAAPAPAPAPEVPAPAPAARPRRERRATKEGF
jgi:hypothetical protein